MAKNKIEHLRDHLFATLEALRDEEQPMDTDRARAIAEVAREIISSAKVEVDFMRITGAEKTTDFIPDGPRQELPPAAPRLLKEVRQ